MVDNFLCNGVMLLLLLLNIVNIVVLKNNGLSGKILGRFFSSIVFCIFAL